MELVSSILETAGATGAPTPGWRAARRSRILCATAELLNRVPLDAVQMDAVARAAGVGKATLYRYFPSKDALLAACFAEVLDRLCAELERVAASRQAPAEQMA